MSDDTEGLIERAGGLLRQPGSPRLIGSVAGGASRSPTTGRRVDPGSGIRHSALPAQFDAELQPVPAPAIAGEERVLRHLLRIVSLHKFTVAATSLLFFVVSAAAILGLTPRYAAVATVAIGNHAPSVATRIQSDVDGTVVQLSPDAAAVHTQVDFLRSRPVAEAAMDRLDLWRRPEFDPAAPPRRGPLAGMRAWMAAALGRLRELVLGAAGSAGPSPASDRAAEYRSAAVDSFLSRLTVGAEPDSQIITIRFEDADPKLAAAAANAVADGYLSRQIAVAAASAQKATAGLEQAVASLRRRVAQSDEVYEEYRGAFEARHGRELLGRQTADSTKELAAAEIARRVLEARLAALRGAAGSATADAATGEVTTSRVMETLHAQAASLEGRLAESSTTLGEANPKIQELRAAVAGVRGEMRAEVARQIGALEAELEVATVKEASLRQSLAASTAAAAQSSPGQAKLDALKVEADANRAVLNAFLTRLHEASTSAKLLQQPNAEIVARASVPHSPISPKTNLLLAVAAIGSMAAGFAAAIFREKAAPTFRSSEEIEVETGIRTLALLPLIENPQAPPEEAFGTPASLYGEAVRTLYMTLLLRPGLKMFVVTSSRAGDGKTSLAASLALIAAKAGRKVLLVDADLCTAGASRLFRLTAQAGLAELIVGSSRFAEVVKTAGGDPNFHFLAAGAPENVLAARSGVEGAAGLLHRLRDDYDLIIVDSPPVLAVADAMALSAEADATLFAVRWAATPRAAVRLGLQRLHASANRTSVGVVLTMVDARSHARYGYADSAFYAKDLVGYYGPRRTTRA